MEDSIFETAVKAYGHYCKNNGIIYDQPSESMSTIGRKYVYLENSHGTLARYDIKTKRIILPE